jgi:hypothetical protein
MKSTRSTCFALLVGALAACSPRGTAPPAAPALQSATQPAATPAAPRLATLPIPGPAAFVAIARDVTDAIFAIDPSVAANAGLFDDAVRLPEYSPARVTALTARLDADLAALRALPWQSYAVDVQMDWRWIYACAETARRQLAVERLFEHRPAQWLEPLSNDLIAFVSYAPERPELQRRTLALVPAMLDDARRVATRVTKRDVDTAHKLCAALVAMAKATRSAEGDAAAAALARYDGDLAALAPTKEYEVIGAESYAWRYRHAMLLPWTPDALVTEAETTLASLNAEMKGLEPHLAPKPTPTEDQRARARALTRDALMALYDDVQSRLRAATIRSGWVSVPAYVGPVRARETPDAMVPLTGDGGSMNPPPTYVSSNVGYWNVEHFHESWTEAERVSTVLGAEGFLTNGMGPYAAHEGIPGHHLQLEVARTNPDPLRSILPDSVQNEGWALYAEGALFEHGGLGDAPDTRYRVLRSLRHRVMRVLFDANVERGAWDLQRAADFKHDAAPGKGEIDEDLLRAVQWPGQLVCYWAGAREILALRDEVKKKEGARFDERAFHDALLAEGSIPIALVRAKMLGEPMPAID